MAKVESIINRFVWIDCEMTGLELDKDQLLEIATIITDMDLNVIEEGPTFIMHQPDEVLDNMIPFVAQLHKTSGLTEASRQSNISVTYAEQQTLSFIQRHCKKYEAVLAGNSVWQDAQFLRKYMPAVTNYLNYRIVDVSTIKLLVRQWYATDPHIKYIKAETHRALADIQESIAELKHYKEHFFR